MNIKESGEDYLEAILMIERQKGTVRSVDVANELNVSKPSVSRAIHILAERGYLRIQPSAQLVLSETGRALAEKIYERHLFISEFLIHIGVSEQVAVIDACRMEHTLSDESFAALKQYILAHRKQS
ncbi:MAG: metal-dependent transcriptional regulator [Erysipelotrichaceae bacterium]|nr:metal-dependent transcriptional regulator [Erysipelotrichaceae bacterium]MCI9311861.1 metal-dependent transcriptional regulator [Erysipelotrichaceae bacterium]